jgi:D-3-phosphoglycerate dehydrogenase
MSKRVLAADGLESSAIAALTKAGFEVVTQFYEDDKLGAALADFDAIVVRSATKVRQKHIDEAVKAGRLKLVIRAGVGVDNIDVEYGRSKGLTVTNTPAASSRSVAELALGHMFALATHIYIANVTMRAGKWEKKNYTNSELLGKQLGLVGFGRIGRCLADMAAALGMKVVYHTRSGAKPDAAPHRFVCMDELLGTSDFVSLHIPKAGDKPLIDAAALAKMKPTAFLVNTARGSLVDEAALVAALDAGKLAGAALDVFPEEPTKNAAIYTNAKISLTPHIGASTAEAQERIGQEVVAIVTKELG